MLMVGDTIISVVGFSIAVGGFVGSIFGMNIPNGFEDSEEMFFKVRREIHMCSVRVCVRMCT